MLYVGRKRLREPHPRAAFSTFCACSTLYAWSQRAAQAARGRGSQSQFSSTYLFTYVKKGYSTLVRHYDKDIGTPVPDRKIHLHVAVNQHAEGECNM